MMILIWKQQKREYFCYRGNLTRLSQQFKQYITKIAALAMNLIALKHFKSYEQQLLNNLNPRINLVIGRNGEGKSNFFKAINFLLTDRVHLTKNQYLSYLHRAIDNVSHPIAVEAYYRNRAGVNGSEASIFRIERIWRDENTEQFRIDDRVFSRGDFSNFLQSLGLTYYSSYNIIQQGKINQVSLMDEVEIYRMLQEATGINKFEKRHENTLADLKKNQEQKEQIVSMLKDIEARLKAYEDRREEFEYYSYEQLANKARSKQDYQEEIVKFNRQLEELKEKQSVSSEEVVRLTGKLKDLKAELQQVNGELIVNQRQILEFAVAPQAPSLDAGLSQEEKSISSDLKKLKKRKEELKAQFIKKSNKVEQFREELKPHKDKYEAMTALLQAQKMSKSEKDKGKTQIKQWLAGAPNALKQIKTQLDKLHKHKSQYKLSASTRQEQDLQQTQKKLEEVQKDCRALKIRLYQNNRLKNQYESQVDIASKMADSHYARMRKVLPLLDFGLLKQIRKSKIEGVYGFMIQFVEIQPTVAFAYEVAGLAKLCSLLVKDEAVCGRVVELNKRLKGRQINILPVSFALRQATEKRNYPSIEDCYSLLNQEWIKVKPHELGEEFGRGIHKIIMNTFHKHVLVKDYDIGLTVSKEYHLNCITAEREIVYSEGYLCKVGKDSSLDDRIEIYTRYSEKVTQMEQTNAKLEQVNKDGMALQNEEMELMRRKYAFEGRISAIQQQLDHITQQKRSFDNLTEQQKVLENKLNKIQEEVKRREQMLANIESKKAAKVNLKDYKAVEEEYSAKMKIFNQLCEQECSLQVRLSEVVKEEEALIQKLTSVKKQLEIRQEVRQELSADQEYKKKTEAQAKRLAQLRQQLEKDTAESEQVLAERQAEDYQLVGTMALLQQQVLFCNTKLAEIGAIELTIEQIQQKSNSFSLSRNFDRKQKPAIVTTKEKLMFSKLSSYFKRVEEQRARYDELLRNEAKLIELLTRYDLDKEQCLNQMFSVFQREFDRIFKKVTGRGTTDIRLKKIADKSRGFLKYKNSISIMVSFDGQATRKWKQFSGGQRTVLAICLLMALQKCEPAPFYVLDEIDAALDPVYLQRIVELIKEESQRSQYFITSFKREMMDFPESICNYYVVEAVQRVSAIKRVSQQEARQMVERIVS